MKVCVFGLWHLGTVTAACLSSAGHQVIGLDFDEQNISRLRKGIPPLFEPDLEDLLKKGLSDSTLEFTTDISYALLNAQIIWVTYDTPVDEDDHADVEYVFEQISRIFSNLEAGQRILVSSQLPVGSIRHLEELLAAARPDINVSISCSPENLRLGRAISVFTNPDRVVIGTRNDEDKHIFSELLLPFTDHIEWMSVESAEMTKHALNAFLAASVTFINEIAAICEQVGADAKEVERGLKTEVRIGAKAYLGPGGAFAGGTLARDIAFLTELGQKYKVPVHLFPAIKSSNDAHKDWTKRRLLQLLKDLRGKTIAVWGLTYKPGTDTLRRSGSIELCKWLLEQGAIVHVHDPVVRMLPSDLSDTKLCNSPLEAVRRADVLVVATEWPQYLSVKMSEATALMNSPLIIDANCFLAKDVMDLSNIRYVSVGKAVNR